MLSIHVTFDETSLLKSTISQQVERLKTKDVSQRVEVDATPPPPVGSVSVRTSSDVIPSGDHIARFHAEQVEDIDENVELFVAIGTKINPRNWVRSMNLKLVSMTSSNCRLLLSMTVLVRSCLLYTSPSPRDS